MTEEQENRHHIIAINNVCTQCGIDVRETD
jgi:hypothetical protein